MSHAHACWATPARDGTATRARGFLDPLPDAGNRAGRAKSSYISKVRAQPPIERLRRQVSPIVGHAPGSPVPNLLFRQKVVISGGMHVTVMFEPPGDSAA